MNTMHAETVNETSLKDICLQVGIWGVFVVGFLAICAGVPMLALNI